MHFCIALPVGEAAIYSLKGFTVILQSYSYRAYLVDWRKALQDACMILLESI